MKISSESDIISYLEHYIFSHPIFEMNKENAIISVLSFVESDFQEFEINIDVVGKEPVNNRLSSAQDILKYSLFHIITHSKEKISNESTEGVFDSDLYNYYKKYQIIHDSLQGVRIKHNTCEINPEDKVIKFGVTSDAVITKIREWKELKKLQRNADKVLEDISPGKAKEIRESLIPAFSKLYYNKKINSSIYDTSKEIISTAYDLIVLNEPYILFGPKLPPDLDFGPYTVGELRLFWRYLNAIILLHTLAFKTLVERELSYPNTASILIISREELLEKIISNSGLSETAAKEIFRDLTYDPLNVNWTEPQYQPLIPLSDDRIIISPLLIGSNNYERNYAVLVEKLTWRKDVQIKLKESHEEHMLSRIIEGIDGLGLNYRPLVKLKEGGNEVSDIDLVIWVDDYEYVLLLSLKWFYGPDSVQEFANYAKRYREANQQQRRIIDFVNEHPSQVIQKCRISHGLTDTIEFLPIIIYETHMPAEQDREKDLPAVALNRFVKIQKQKVKNLYEVYRKILREYNSYPSVGITVDKSEIIFGDYTFIIPKMKVKRNE